MEKEEDLIEEFDLGDLIKKPNRELGREERYRTVISGMEPRRIAVVMLLPRAGSLLLNGTAA